MFIFLNTLCVHFSLGTRRGTSVSSFSKIFLVLLQAVVSTTSYWNKSEERKTKGKSSGVCVKPTTCLGHVSTEMKIYGETSVEVSDHERY